MSNQKHKDDERNIIIMDDEDSEKVLNLLFITFEKLCTEHADNIIANKIAGVLQITAKCIESGLLQELDEKIHEIVYKHPKYFNKSNSGDSDLVLVNYFDKMRHKLAQG